MSEISVMPSGGGGVRWIGGESGGVQLFRREFRLEEEAACALLQITADRRYRLRVNGMWFGDGPEGALPGRWNFDRYELSSLLRVGANFLEVQVIPPETENAVAMLAAGLTVRNGDGRELFSCVTDEAWSCVALPALSFRDGVELFDAAAGPGVREPAQTSAAGETLHGALHCRAVAPQTRIERLFRSAQGGGLTRDPEALLYPDDRCTVLGQNGDTVNCSTGETVNGCWNVVLRCAAGNVIEFYPDRAALPAVRYTARGGWQRFTTSLPRRSGEVTLKLVGPGPVEIQSLRLVEAAYPAVLRSSFTASDAREERRWEQECAALARRLGVPVTEAAELPDLVTAAARIFGASDWAEEELSRQLFLAAARPAADQLQILLAAARYLEEYGAPAWREEWQVCAEERLRQFLSLPENTLTLAEEFQLCGLLKRWGLTAEAQERETVLADTWNPLRLAFCRTEKESRENAIRANLHALAAHAVPAAHLASLRAEAAALTGAEKLLIVPELPAELGGIDAVLAALPLHSGRSPLYQTEFLLGLRFQAEGAHCTFSPWIGSENCAEGRLHTRFGEVLARWRREERAFTAEVALPEGMAAEFVPNPSLAGLAAHFALLTREEWERARC